MKHPFVLAITGASGVLYTIRLLEVLLQRGAEVHLIVSPSGRVVLQQELGVLVNLDRFRLRDLTQPVPGVSAGDATEMQRTIRDMLRGLDEALTPPGAGHGRVVYHHHSDFMSPVASGSFLTGGMIVCPCSGGTLSAVVHGSSDNLIQRAADVHLKERRKLILVPRETPLSSIQLDNMKRACDAGAVVLPAMPGWYHGVRTICDLIDFIVARILDQLGVEHTLMRRWGEADLEHENAASQNEVLVGGPS
jgi:4-hydroxy-3-polyprenylbenzoate decarboxylase